MSRVANNPVELPKGVEVKLDGSALTVKGSLGTLELALVEGIKVSQEDNVVTIGYDSDATKAMAGTTRAGKQYGQGRQRGLGEETGAERRRLSRQGDRENR